MWKSTTVLSDVLSGAGNIRSLFVKTTIGLKLSRGGSDSKVMSWGDTVEIFGIIKVEKRTVIDIHGVPADTMIGMRAGLRGTCPSVLQRRFDAYCLGTSRQRSDVLEELFDGAVQPAVVPTSAYNSFEVFSELKDLELAASAKPGDIAPVDIVVEKQDTGMPPGPIVDELNSIGIPAKIWVVPSTSKRHVALEMEKSSRATLVCSLDKSESPIVTGLRLCGTYEDGVVFSPSTLDVDFEQFEQDLSVWRRRIGLACNITWFATNHANIARKASRRCCSQARCTTAETLPHLLGRAHRSTMGIAGRLTPPPLTTNWLLLQCGCRRRPCDCR